MAQPDPLEHLLRYANPNPQRIGCPGTNTLQALARKELPIDHPASDHLGECSPCYREFLVFKKDWKRRRRTQALLRCAAILVFIGLLGWFWRRQSYQPHREVATNTASQAPSQNQLSPQKTKEPLVAVLIPLDFRPLVMDRGTNSLNAEQTWHIPARLITLDITLPFGSDDGQYQLEVRAQNHHVLKRISGLSHIEKGNTILRVSNLDLSVVPTGHYLLFFHHADASWRYAQIQIDSQ